MAVEAGRSGGKVVKELTNAFVVDGARVLLGMKKRGFGVGKWNGFGGKLAPGETPLAAAQREYEEEAGVRMKDPVLIGTVCYEYDTLPQRLLVHIFRATAIEPETPTESEEMRPSWFGLDSIPYAQMWPDDVHWYEPLLRGDRFSATFHFGDDMDTIKDFKVAILGKGEPFQEWQLSPKGGAAAPAALL